MPVVLRNSIASSHTSGEKYKKLKKLQVWMICICPCSLHLELRSREALEKQYLFRGSINFQLVFITFTFTFMHLADAFIQSDLHCIQVTVSTFYQLLLSLGIEPMILALLVPCSTS